MDAVPTMDELLAEHGVTGSAVDHLHRLVADWQLLADLSFADLILFVPTQPGRFVAVAQMRPTTGPTAYQDDVVGHEATSVDRPQLGVDPDPGGCQRVVAEEPAPQIGQPVLEPVDRQAGHPLGQGAVARVPMDRAAAPEGDPDAALGVEGHAVRLALRGIDGGQGLASAEGARGKVERVEVERVGLRSERGSVRHEEQTPGRRDGECETRHEREANASSAASP